MHQLQSLNLGIALVMLTATAVFVFRFVGIAMTRAVVVTVIRAAAQLALVGLALAGAINNRWFTAPILIVMAVTAIATAARRLGAGSWRDVATAICGGTSVVLVIDFGSRVVPLNSRYVLAVAGITIGGAMTSAIIAGRAFDQRRRDRRDEVEAWLAIGATSMQAVQHLMQLSITDAVIPGMDQTRTVGLVALPGTFVGALLSGASPAKAGQFQLVTLIGLLACQAVTATTLLRLRARHPLLTVELHVKH